MLHHRVAHPHSPACLEVRQRVQQHAPALHQVQLKDLTAPDATNWLTRQASTCLQGALEVCDAGIWQRAVEVDGKLVARHSHGGWTSTDACRQHTANEGLDQSSWVPEALGCGL